MPITQDRMLAIILAANDYREAYEATRKALRQALTELRGHNPSIGDITEALSFNVERALTDEANSKAILAIETSQIRRNYRDNEARKQRAINRRRRQELPELPPKPEQPITAHLRALAAKAEFEPLTSAPKSADARITYAEAVVEERRRHRAERQDQEERDHDTFGGV